MCTGPSQFGIPQPENELLGYMVLLHINTHLHRTETYPCWLDPMYLSASPSCSKNYLSQNGLQRVFLCYLPPLDSLNQTSIYNGSIISLRESISFPVIAVASTWVSSKSCFSPSFCSLLKSIVPPDAVKMSIKQWNWEQRPKLETSMHHHAQIINVRWCFVALTCEAH